MTKDKNKAQEIACLDVPEPTPVVQAYDILARHGACDCPRYESALKIVRHQHGQEPALESAPKRAEFGFPPPENLPEEVAACLDPVPVSAAEPIQEAQTGARLGKLKSSQGRAVELKVAIKYRLRCILDGPINRETLTELIDTALASRTFLDEIGDL